MKLIHFLKGMSGDSGYQGVPGLKGFIGDPGYPGLPGLDGLIGYKGIQVSIEHFK